MNSSHLVFLNSQLPLLNLESSRLYLDSLSGHHSLESFHSIKLVQLDGLPCLVATVFFIDDVPYHEQCCFF